MTDEAAVYEKLGREFAGHGTVNHSADEYARLGGFIHTNTAESFFALLKRAVYGQFHHVSEAHLHRYLSEADFKYNHRFVSDAERADALLRGAKGNPSAYPGDRCWAIGTASHLWRGPRGAGSATDWNLSTSRRKR